MPGLVGAFRQQWPQQPMARDPMMPIPYRGPQTFNLGELMQQPVYQEPQPPQGFLSPGFADFLHSYFNQRQL